MTTTDLTTNEDNIDFFKQYADETSGRRFVGPLLKFAKGDYSSDGEKIPLGTRYVALMASLTIGWVKWEDNYPIDHRMGLVAEGFKAPKREDLGDTDKDEWEDGRDPWQRTNYIVFADLENHELCTFTSSSRGGLGAIGELCKVYSPRWQEEELRDQMPVIELTSREYKHREFGKIRAPSLKVIEWVDGAPYFKLLNAARAGMTTNGGGETVKKIAKPATKKLAKPMPKSKNGRSAAVKF
jgi:hypothetical protein